SSGEYAGLKAAAATAAGAAAAGAGTQAIQATQNAGIGLQEQNVTFGQTMPASALNAINTQYGGEAGAVNAGESAVNTGSNAYNTAQQYYNTAMGITNNGLSGQNTQSHTTTVGGSDPLTYDVHTGAQNPVGGQLPSTNVAGLNQQTGIGQPMAHGGLVEPEGYRRGGRVKRPHVPQGGGGGATGD